MLILSMIIINIYTILYVYIKNLTKEEILWTVLITNIISLIQIIIIYENYDIININNNMQNLFGGIIGIDSISISLILLEKILMPIIILNIWNKKINKNNILLFMILSLSCIIIFVVMDTILFYIFYEIVLIPMFYLISYYGSRNRKRYAIYLFYIYTLIGSLLLLISFIYLYIQTGSSYYELLTYIKFSFNEQKFLLISIFLAFAIKIPMVPVHLWLPEAHSESPTGVSIYLAAILLKLGVYGMIRFILPILPDALELYKSYILTLAIIGIIYTSLACLSLWDIKKIIAYSSIGHMNLAILGLFSNNILGINSSLYFMISHGLISSGLFLLIGILYDRYHTRIILYYKGLALILPLFITLFGFFIFSNIGFPLTSGFISEILTFFSLFKLNPILGIFSTLAIILTPLYALWFYHQISFGRLSPHILAKIDLTRKEFAMLLPLIFFIILFGINPMFLFDIYNINTYFLFY